MKLNRSIGTVGLLFSAVGGIVGSGWLLGPLFAAKIAGPAAIISWIIGGILMMIIALTYAELSSMLPLPGGTVRFLHFSHGTLASFTVGWLGWLASAAVPPIETMALVHYANNYWPGLIHKVQGTMVLSEKGLAFSIALLLIISAVNFLGVRLLSKTNNFVVALKLFFPLATLIVLLSLDFHAHNFVSHGFAPMGFKGILAALPSAGVIFAFIGYAPAIQLAGEAKNPQRAIPVAILGALVICIVLYVGLQASFIGAMPAKSLAHGWANLSFSGEAGPFAGLAVAVGAIWLSQLILVGSFISPFGTALIYTGSTARMTYAMGENGFLPKSFLKLNRFGIPSKILLINFVIGVILFLPFPTWQSMMSFLVAALVLAYTVGPLSLRVLRHKMPDANRPFHVKFAKIITIVGFYICNLIIYWTGWHIFSSMLIAIVIGYAVLALFMMSKYGKGLDLNIGGGFWMLPYLAIMGVMSYLGSFGGGRNIIAFGWDFLLLAVVTLIFYKWSHVAGRNSMTDLVDIPPEDH